MKHFKTLTRHEPISHFAQAWARGWLHSESKMWNLDRQGEKSQWRHYNVSCHGRQFWRVTWWERVCDFLWGVIG